MVKLGSVQNVGDYRIILLWCHSGHCRNSFNEKGHMDYRLRGNDILIV